MSAKQSDRLRALADEFDLMGVHRMAGKLRREADDVARLERALDEIARDAEEGAAMAEMRSAMRGVGAVVH